MKIALAQINTTVGDLAGNVARCLEAIGEGARLGADLVILPEMAVPGYPPRDILLDTSFVEAAGEATQDLALRARESPPTLVGTIAFSGNASIHHPGLHNIAALLQGGKVTTAAAKCLLPVYDVFLEPRWFVPGPPSTPVAIGAEPIGVLICEDMWDESYAVHPGARLVSAGARLLAVLSATPYRHGDCVGRGDRVGRGIEEERLYHARRQGCPLVHVNQCGATDELIFDGASFAINGDGETIAQLPRFEEAVAAVDMDAATPIPHRPGDGQASLFSALTLGIRDFARKNGVRRVFLGLSGGVDSSVVAVLAAEALGSANVTGIAIPSRYSDPRSTACAEMLANALGIGVEIVALEPLHRTAEETLGDLLEGTAAENVQARLRMMILMAFVNRRGGMLLNTSNKTELTVGYGTLYGDLAGTLSPIGDLTKPEVYKLAHWIQKTRDVFPDFVLTRPPSAELKPNQVDPFDYPEIAPLLERLVRANRSNVAIRRAEHKRWHHGIILKVSEKAFGTGRLIPVTRR